MSDTAAEPVEDEGPAERPAALYLDTPQHDHVELSEPPVSDGYVVFAADSDWG